MNVPARFFPNVVPAMWTRGSCIKCARYFSRTCVLYKTEREHIVSLTDNLSVKQLASKARIKEGIILSKIKELNLTPKKSGALSIGDCEKLVLSLGRRLKYKHIIRKVADREKKFLKPRPPVVAVMGHVDHGKTTLLDSLRKTAVAQSEAGGITQHIGAFSVSLPSGAKLTFLDTPGHAAFSNMRARGAQATDMVILVVAADDGVKEQTVESIRMIKDAKVPMVVAINKCDKHVKDIARVKQELLKAQVQLEEYGGEVQGVELSALNGEGLDTLEEALLALSDLSQFKGDISGAVQAVVIETRVDKGLGPTATLVIQHGILRPGDYLVAGASWCKVRVMQDERGQKVTEAPPSTPILTCGWKQLPMAGEICLQAKSEEAAKLSCEDYDALQKSRSSSQMPHPLVTPSQDAKEELESDVSTMPLLVKGDVTGSVEALVAILESRQPKQKTLKVIHTGVGPVTEGDVDMAAATKGIVLAFGVSTPKSLSNLIKIKKVKVITSQVIYKLLDLLKDELEAGLGVLEEEEELGQAEVIQVYHMTGNKAATIAGSIVRHGKMVRSAIFRVTRKGKVLHEGELSGMRNKKQDISVANLNTEVGFKFVKEIDFEEGDRVVCVKKNEVRQTLQWDLGF